MKLLAEINEASSALKETTNFVTENLKILISDGAIGIEQIDEAVQQFLNTYANKIANGQLEGNPKVKENVINVFAALQALSQKDLADAYNDVPGQPLGQILNDFYGKNGKEAHKIAAARLNMIGKHPSSRSYRTQAEQAVNSPEHITAYANKIRTNIEPVMNKMLSKERQEAQGRLDKQAEEKKRENMARPMVGAIPNRA